MFFLKSTTPLQKIPIIHFHVHKFKMLSNSLAFPTGKNNNTMLMTQLKFKNYFSNGLKTKYIIFLGAEGKLFIL